MHNVWAAILLFVTVDASRKIRHKNWELVKWLGNFRVAHRIRFYVMAVAFCGLLFVGDSWSLGKIFGIRQQEVKSAKIPQSPPYNRSPDDSQPQGSKAPAKDLSVDTKPKLPGPAKTTPLLPKKAVPPFYRTDEFWTYVLSNPSDENNPIVCANSSSQMRQAACFDTRDVVKKHLAGQGIFTVNAVVLQHYLLALVLHSGDEPNITAGGSTGTKEIKLPSIDIPDVEIYSMESVFSNPSDEDVTFFPWWFQTDAKRGIRLPKETIISLVHMTAREWQQDAFESYGSYVLRLERKKYFSVDMHVTPHKIYQQGVLPDKYDIGISPDPSSQIITYVFAVQFDCAIQRDTSDPTFVAEDYERWANDLFERMRKKLED
jgi:hypothetical protein